MDESEALALAARQGGVITRRQAMDLGYRRGQIDYRVATGRWVRPYGSTYRLLPPLDELDLVRGAQTAMPRAIVSHGSAGRLLGLEGVPAGEATVSVTDDHAHEFVDVVVRRSAAGFPASHRTRRSGVVLTSPARTVVDLSGHMPERPWHHLAQAAVVSRACTVAEIARVAEVVCGRGRPGSTLVREFLADEAVAMSALERRAATLLAPLRPVPQFPAPWDRNRRLDFAIPRARLGIELDSRRWHSTEDRFAADRRRDRAAAAAGWLIVRITWDDLLHRPDETLRSIIEIVDERTPVSGPA